MGLQSKLTRAGRIARDVFRDPRGSGAVLNQSHGELRGFQYGLHWRPSIAHFATVAIQEQPGDLRRYFDAHRTGRGIWKWTHYFDIYERHFRQFKGQEVHLLEVGIYSGGSIEMWRSYFGDKCHVYGVDIEPACRAYAGPSVDVFIGDQGDRTFWRSLLVELPPLTIIIDDGSHRPEHQIVTLEETLPHLGPGGVYLCEDVHHTKTPFTSYVAGLAHQLNDAGHVETDPVSGGLTTSVNAWQGTIDSIHLYPYVAVIERAARERQRLECPKHGTEWQPFL